MLEVYVFCNTLILWISKCSFSRVVSPFESMKEVLNI
jgi:hypothetical protein